MCQLNAKKISKSFIYTLIETNFSYFEITHVSIECKKIQNLLLATTAQPLAY